MTTYTEAILRTYLERMAEIRSTGGATSETSYYSALENLLNDIGKTLKPPVVCNGQLRNQGAGHPDFGLYNKNQCSKGEPKPGQGEIPERGVIEVKSLSEKTWQTAKGEQATKYFKHYRLVLVTNYRDFRLIGEGPAGKPIEREFYSLAPDEISFWAAAAHPVKTARDHAVHFDEFIRRVLMNAAPLTRPEDVAWFLASYARDALKTIADKDASILKPLRDALETALGIKFEGNKGDHFFKSTLVQTLFYGVFSAWVISSKDGLTTFDWKTAGYVLTVPMIRTLFAEVAHPMHLGPLGVSKILDRTGEALNRVDKIAFFKSFDSGHAIQHFYEPFLHAFDPELRKDLGVWYTPPEIVQYMVERVDRALRTELSLPDGLADKNVYVLDPCCGTGAYVVEVLRRIERTLREKGADALIGEDLKEIARERVFGFEILPASFVVAHWQVANLLTNLGATLDPGKGERPSIYLTNALTGWKPPTGPKATLSLFPELQEERDAAEHVKREIKILVVLGNPPYNAFAGTSPEEEQKLVEPYKEGLITTWGIKKFNLDDLYIRFYRIAERKIMQTGRGIVSYISNYSYVSEPSYVVMRQTLLKNFDKFWIENMHGDRNRTEYAPDGRTSETVFAIHGFSPGIRQGVVIGLAVKTGKPNEAKVVRYRDDIDAAKAHERRKQLLDSLHASSFDDQYELADPQPWNRLSFRPGDVGLDYLAWPKLVDLCTIAPINGLMEKRGGALIDIDRKALSSRMKSYFDPKIDWEGFKLLGSSLSKNAASFDAKKARRKLLNSEPYDENKVIKYLVRPFDVRFAYYTAASTVWNRSRPELWSLYRLKENAFLISRMVKGGNPEGPPFLFSNAIGDDHCLRTDAYFFAAYYQNDAGPLIGTTIHANLSAEARTYLSHLGLSNPDIDKEAAEAIWLHSLAIGFSPRYLEENSYGLSIDWPRIPLPNGRAAFDHSIELGRRLSKLIDTETDILGVTSAIAEHLKVLGLISATDLRVTAGWGSRDSKGRINPGQGRVEVREWSESEQVAFISGFEGLGISKARGLKLLGRAVDVYLNPTTSWRAIPEAAWEYFIGGYQVIKKWLSYREETLLGRALTTKEAREVTGMVRRLTAIVLLRDTLDANYATVRKDTYPWSKAV